MLILETKILLQINKLIIKLVRKAINIQSYRRKNYSLCIEHSTENKLLLKRKLLLGIFIIKYNILKHDYNFNINFMKTTHVKKKMNLYIEWRMD